MSIIAREKKPKGGGQSPQFKMRIDPALKLVEGTREGGFADEGY